MKTHLPAFLRKITAGTLVIAAAIAFTAAVSFAQTSTAPDADALNAGSLKGKHFRTVTVAPKGGRNGMRGAGVNGTTVDSVPTFNGQYFAPGYYYDANGNAIYNSHWYTNTLGNAPQLGGTTTFNAPIIPVSLDMRNFDGSPRYVRLVNGKVSTCNNANQPGCHRLYYDATTYSENGTSLLDLVLSSPIFANANYSSSSTATQFTDAVQRAGFYKLAKSDWHTLLNPAPKTPKQPYVMTLIRGTYFFSLNPDGSCCAEVAVDYGTFVNALFPPTLDLSDTSTIIGRAEHGDITQHDISTFLFPNTVLYAGTLDNCCLVGFHSFDFEIVNNVTRFYVLNYSGWISQLLGDATVGDITALSHEIAETFNDPFVVYDGIHNSTQFWLSPNGLCQNNLEVGDVIEGLPNQTFPMMLQGFLYHPQNEALLQWFSGGSTSIDGALSYPDESVLSGTTGVFNPPLFSNCQPTQ